MKRNRKKKRARARRIIVEHSQASFFRLCHSCLFLNEAEHEIPYCTKCHHSFVPELGAEEITAIKQQIAVNEFDKEQADEEGYLDEDEDPTESQILAHLTGLSVVW